MTAFAALAGLATALGRPWRTRFAPAPTGWLHLGHVVNAIWVWGLARAHGGRVLLRIEDHDRGRCRAEHERDILDDLEWLGFVPDDGRGPGGRLDFRQSDHGARYAAALDALDEARRVYACTCSRRDITAVAGGAMNEETRYPGTCRERGVPREATAARRVRLDDGAEAFVDLRLGPQRQRPSEQCGDLLVRDRHGDWTYQWCVVVDDRDQQVDVVIRGEDILGSTGRQVALTRLLGRAAPPRYLHHPLIRHPGGAKLSKANRDTGIRDLRAAGRSPAEVLGMAAQASGLVSERRAVRVEELAALLSVSS